MELTKEYFRAVVHFCFTDSLSTQQCIEKLKRLYGSKSPSQTTIYNWCNQIKLRRSMIANKFRKGRPVTVVTEENVSVMRKLI